MHVTQRDSREHRLRAAVALSLACLGAVLAAPTTALADEDAMAPERLHGWVRELCEFQPRWAGYPAEQQATHWLAARLESAGIPTEIDTYPFRKWQLDDWEVSVISNAAEHDVEVFPMWSTRGGSGEAALVDVGGGSLEELQAQDIRGKAVVVDGNALFNVFASYKNTYRDAAELGAAVMFVTSGAPENLIRPTSSSGNALDDNPIPAFQMGADDLAELREAARAGAQVRWRLDAEHVDGETHDVVATLKGSGLYDGAIVVAAHYDAWFTGALDNATGVSGLIGLAEHFAQRPRWLRPRDIIFVGVTGHDAGYPHLGMHHWVEAHPDLIPEIDLFMNLDHLAAAAEEHVRADTWLGDIDFVWDRAGDEERVLFTTAHPKLAETFEPLLQAHGLWAITLPTVPWLTANGDLEGLMGDLDIPTVNLTMATPHYHTVEDTPDRIPAEQLSRAVTAHRDFLEEMIWMFDGTIHAGW